MFLWHLVWPRHVSNNISGNYRQRKKWKILHLWGHAKPAFFSENWQAFRVTYTNKLCQFWCRQLEFLLQRVIKMNEIVDQVNQRAGVSNQKKMTVVLCCVPTTTSRVKLWRFCIRLGIPLIMSDLNYPEEAEILNTILSCHFCWTRI